MRDTNSTFYDLSTVTPGAQLTPHTLDARDSDLIIQQQQDIHHHHHNQQTPKRNRTRDEDARDDIDAAIALQGGRQAKRRFCSTGQEQKAQDQQEPWQPVIPAKRSLSSFDTRVHSHILTGDTKTPDEQVKGGTVPSVPVIAIVPEANYMKGDMEKNYKSLLDSQSLCQLYASLIQLKDNPQGWNITQDGQAALAVRVASNDWPTSWALYLLPGYRLELQSDT